MTAGIASPVEGGGRSRTRSGPRALAWAKNAALALVAAICVLMLAPPLLGLERYVVTGGSMEGEIPRGSVVFEEVAPVADLEAGDVITYQPPAGVGGEGLVTHRILSIGHGADGAPVIRTQGDANAKPDPWRFTPDGAQQPRVVAHVPYVGYALAALGVREVRMLFIGVPALALAFGLLAGLWRDTSPERIERTAETAAAGGST